jgi:hypothetical protein
MLSVGTKSNWVDLLTVPPGYAMQPAWLLYVQGGGAARNSDVHFSMPPAPSSRGQQDPHWLDHRCRFRI